MTKAPLPPELTEQLESLGGHLVWRVGKQEGREEIVVRLGYASATPRFAHLHIDLLPRAQGGGYGRKLMRTLWEALSAAGSPGVHLGVGKRNSRAVTFYDRLGFVRLAENPGAFTLGLRLPVRP